MSDDETVRIRPAAADDPVVLTGPVERTTAISFSPDGKPIAGIDGVMRLWQSRDFGRLCHYAQGGRSF